MQHMGKKFSGGERQLFANARALVGKKPQIILDEPASNLDPESERNLLDYVALLGEHSRLVVSHRYTSFQGVDRIVVFKNGRIEDQGTPEQLLENTEGTFYKHFMLQAEGLPGVEFKDGDLKFKQNGSDAGETD